MDKEKKTGLPHKLVFLEMPETSIGGFLDPVVDHFQKKTEVEYIKSSNPKQIRAAVNWADTVWLEWGNQMAEYATRELPELYNKKVVCRLHGYELFTDFPQRINWDAVDSIIFVANHKRDLFNKKILHKTPPQYVIRNGIDTSKFTIPAKKRNNKNLVLLGDLNFRKGVPILLQFFNELLKRDHEYRLFIRGKFKDPLLEMAVKTMIKELSLEGRIEFVDFIHDLDAWFADKSHILSFSLEESFHYALGEGMAAGLKPVINAWRESREIWPNEYIFNDLSGFLRIVLNDDYIPDQYRKYIFDRNLDLKHQLQAIETIVRRVHEKPKYVANLNRQLQFSKPHN